MQFNYKKKKQRKLQNNYKKKNVIGSDDKCYTDEPVKLIVVCVNVPESN